MVLDTYFNEHSNKASNLAVGGVLVGIDNIISKRWRNAFAVVRPPGHHSGARNVINGFCIYNNVAIGVKYLRNKYNLKKIAIFDWDVHHGDGTQHILREDPDTLFISLHRHDNGTFYPG
jgi:acetoin utilization deacetylase AcuC-like enzyme